MAIPRTLKDFNLFIDGRGYAGKVEELELPKLTVKTEEYRGGGMDGAVEIDMGTEKLEAKIVLAEYEPEVLKLWGLADGSAVQLTARGALQADGLAVVPVVVNLRGSIKELDWGAWKSGDRATLSLAVAARYYRLDMSGSEIIEIDIENKIRKVGGVDQIAAIRAAIGL